MGLLSFLGLKTAKDVIGGVADAGSKIVNTIKGTNPELAGTMTEFLGKVNEAQAAINKENAKLGRGNWRSALGWVCVGAVVLHYLIFPTVDYIFRLLKSTVPAPTLDLRDLIALLVLLLGGAGVKVVEKKIMQRG